MISYGGELDRRRSAKNTKKFERPSIFMNLNRQHPPRFTFRDHLKRTAANFAIGGEPLRGDAGVDHQFTSLAAKRTADVFRDFHFEDKLKRFRVAANYFLGLPC